MLDTTSPPATENGYALADPALKSRARIKCRFAARGSRPSFDDVWEINATTAEPHLLPSGGLPNSRLNPVVSFNLQTNAANL
jgi:hypothetical protein